MNRGHEHQPAQPLAPAITRILEENSTAALATLVEAGQGVGAKMLVEESGTRVGTLGDPVLDEAAAKYSPLFLASRAEARLHGVDEFEGDLKSCEGARVLFERIEPEPRLVICGAGHVGASLAHLALLLGYRVTVIDDRAGFVARDRFPNPAIETVLVEDWGLSVLKTIGRGRRVAVAVVTRGHKEDAACVRAVLSTGADYVGMIGGKRRTGVVLDGLRREGTDEETLKRVRAPIGLDLGAVTPEEVALAILAEMVAQRRGGTGVPLSSRRSGNDR
jgi:xanthine dehydrogenase accessory factor